LLGRLAAQHRAVTTETLVEAAARTKVYINTLRRWCRKGRLLPAIHKGHVHRLDPAKVDAVVNARRPQRVEGT
jgi:predicted site-specific integrase-resolvase